MSDTELIREILSQIVMAIGRIERRFQNIKRPDNFLDSEEGLDRLDGICMMLIAIGESLKNLDKVTDGLLLKQFPEIDWKGAKGARDILSHHYLNALAGTKGQFLQNKVFRVFNSHIFFIGKHYNPLHRTDYSLYHLLMPLAESCSMNVCSKKCNGNNYLDYAI